MLRASSILPASMTRRWTGSSVASSSARKVSCSPNTDGLGERERRHHQQALARGEHLMDAVAELAASVITSRARPQFIST